MQLKVLTRDAALVVALGLVLGLGSNALRVGLHHIPLVAAREYQILVPCPEYEGKAGALQPSEVPAQGQRVILVDARDAESYGQWQMPGSISVPFDWLEETPEARIKALSQRVLQARARRVIVYGDGDDPDSGQHLANELSGRGIRNVSYVKGGAPALRKSRGGQR